MPNLNTLTNAELVHFADSRQESLTSTALEVELTNRLALVIEEQQPLIDLLEEKDVNNVEDLQNLLNQGQEFEAVIGAFETFRQAFEKFNPN